MKWTAIALINRFYRDKTNVFGSGISFGDVSIQKKPSWVDDEDTKSELGFNQKCTIEESKYCFAIEYEAASDGDPDPAWRGEKQRSKQNINTEKIMFCNLALWLARPTSLNFDLLIHFQNEGRHLMRISSNYPRLLPHEREKNNSLSRDDTKVAQAILKEVSGLEREGPIWIALHTLWTALTASQADWTIRYLMIWVALEALFGTNIEIAHRLSERISFFLGKDKADAKEKYRMSKKCYDWRSKIVHGRGMERLDAALSEQILYDSECFIRESVKKILLDGKMIKNFNGNNRDEYLDELVFQS